LHEGGAVDLIERRIRRTPEENMPDNEYSTLLFDVRNNVGYITLNRPEAANALNAELAHDLMEVSLRCEEDPSVRAVLMNAAGKLFCAGGDLKSFAAQPKEMLPTYFKKVTFQLHKAISRFNRMKAPVVLAIQGAAGGAGMSLACAGARRIFYLLSAAYRGAKARDGPDAHQPRALSPRGL
jgi:enoyl-CoA hydratase/carnithine racemase